MRLADAGTGPGWSDPFAPARPSCTSLERASSDEPGLLAGAMSRLTLPTQRTWNWPADQTALRRRGWLTIRFARAMPWEAATTGKRGRQPEDRG